MLSAILGAALVATATTPALASLAEADLLVPDDALVTRDTTTGLDWLDFTQSVGLSFDDILQDAANTWQADGWRHATTLEVCALLSSQSVSPSPVCPGAFTSISAATASSFVSFFGTSGIGGSRGHPAATAYFDDGGDTSIIGLMRVALATDEADGPFSIVVVSHTASTTISPIAGQALVRASPVPEPSTGILFGVALTFVAISSRRSDAS